MCDTGIYAIIGNDDDTAGSPWLRNSDCNKKCYDVFSGSTTKTKLNRSKISDLHLFYIICESIYM